MSDSFFKDRRVLITGYEGFLGSHISRALIGKKSKIIGLDIQTNRETTILTKSELSSMKVINGDVSEYFLVCDVVKEYKIELVFHLAAEALVNDCFHSPLTTFRTNIQGTWNILEASRVCDSVQAVVIASSDKAYGVHAKLPYRETTPLRGTYTYDVSKSCADLIADSYSQSYNLQVGITRCGNIYGPGDYNFSRLIPGAIKSVLQGEEFLIRSSGEYIRDYVYIDDIVNGYLLLGEKLVLKRNHSGAFNFSNGEPLSVLDVTKKIYTHCGRKPAYRILDSAHHEIKKQYLCSEKSRKDLAWQPKFNLDSGLEQTIKWYKNSRKKV